jgi:hypothetical protein
VTTDLHETILNMAGYVSEKNNQTGDGINLNPMIKSPSYDWPIRPLFFHYPHYYETTSPVSAIIHKDFKLLHYAETDGIELYDLSKGIVYYAEMVRVKRGYYTIQAHFP